MNTKINGKRADINRILSMYVCGEYGTLISLYFNIPLSLVFDEQNIPFSRLFHDLHFA